MNSSKKITLIFVAIFILFLNTNIFAAQETKEYSKLYQEYLNLSDEEKAKVEVIPRMYDVPIDELYGKSKIISKPLTMLSSRISAVAKNSTLPNSFILLDDDSVEKEYEKYGGINIPIRNQGSKGLCWNFASLKALETYLELRGTSFDLSESHLDYLTSKEFGGERQLHDAGNFSDFEKYASRNYGPTLEADFPYEKEYTIVEYDNLLNVDPVAYVGKTINFPTMYKDLNGENNYTDEDLINFRRKVKEHIMKNGGLYTSILSPDDGMPYYNSMNNSEYTTQNTDESTTRGYHAVTIIGWDDNYSKDNFNSDCRPSNDGAYIAMNSWGDWGDNGLFYISYEDYYVETQLAGIENASIDKSSYKQIQFEDENLYNIVKEKFVKSTLCDDTNKIIYTSESALVDIHELDISDMNLTSLAGIEIFPKLYRLCCNNNSITSIEPLAKLKDLGYIELNNNNISNIQPLENLSDWSEIKLSHNNITDISPIMNHKFATLDLSYNPIDLSKKVPYSSYLYLDGCNVKYEDVEKILLGFEYAPRLLSLRNNNIVNFYDRIMLSETTVDLSENPGINLKSLKHIGGLILQNNNLTNISDLGADFAFASLDVSNNPISDINILNGRDLYKVNLSHTNVKDVSGLTNVKILDISGNTGVQGLQSLNLEKIIMDDCNLDNNSLEGLLSNIPSITGLSVNNNNLTNLETLKNYTSIESIEANNNKITDISALSKFNYLKKLDLRNNLLTDISPLSLVDLRDSDVLLDGNQIEEFEFETVPYGWQVYGQKVEKEVSILNISETILDAPTTIAKAFKYTIYDGAKIQCENCSLESLGSKIRFNRENKIAKVKVIGGKFDGLEYTFNLSINTDIEATQIYFPDKNIYDIVKNKTIFEEQANKIHFLSYDDKKQIVVIPKDDINNITWISAPYCDITDMAGLEKFEKLNNIILYGNLKLKKLGDVAKLPNLQSINIRYTGIEDIYDLLNNPSVQKISVFKADSTVQTFNNDDYMILPKYVYQALTMEENVTATANIYYDTVLIGDNSREINDYYNTQTTEVVIDKEQGIAKAKLDFTISEEKPAGIRAIEVEINGGKANGGMYQGFYEVSNISDNIDITFKDKQLYERMKKSITYSDERNGIEVRTGGLISQYDDSKNQITVSKELIKQVKYIDIMMSNITDISGLEYFTNLQEINLSYNPELKNIDNLLGLEKLESINAVMTKVEDIGKFLGKEGIQNIYMRQNIQNDMYTKKDVIELPTYMYQAMTMQRNINYSGKIYYETNYYDDEKLYHAFWEGQSKDTDITIDKEKQIASVKLDYEVTNEKKAGIRAVTVEVKGDKTPIAAYHYYYNVEEEGYPDVTKNDWFYNAVKYVSDLGMMNGYTAGADNGKFGPNDNITRGQIVTILYRRENKPNTSEIDMTFNDVGPYYYYDAIKWAAKNGIVTGHTAGENAGKFMPDDPITREQLAAILQRYANYKGKSDTETIGLEGFKDYQDVSPWALEGLKWVVSKGIITGDLATTPPSINPQGNATRAQAATMIMRFCENIK